MSENHPILAKIIPSGIVICFLTTAYFGSYALLFKSHIRSYVLTPFYRVKAEIRFNEEWPLFIKCYFPAIKIHEQIWWGDFEGQFWKISNAMLIETDIQIIQQFTCGEVEKGNIDSSSITVYFSDEDLRFSLIASPQSPSLALFVSTSTGRRILQYEFPASRVVETKESFHEGNFHIIASLNFYPEASDRSALSIAKRDGKFFVDPIWGGELSEKEA